MDQETGPSSGDETPSTPLHEKSSSPVENPTSLQTAPASENPQPPTNHASEISVDHIRQQSPLRSSNLAASYAFQQQQEYQRQYDEFQQRHSHYPQLQQQQQQKQQQQQQQQQQKFHASQSPSRQQQQQQQYQQQQQQYQQKQQYTMNNTISHTVLSEKYSAAFRAVDARITSYLSRFLRRAQQGPEQERQLLQVIQVEIRDLLRKTLDAEAEVVLCKELLAEGSVRLEEQKKGAEAHLEGVLKGQEERVKELKLEFQSSLKEKTMEIEGRFKRDKRELEERVVFAEAEMNHRLKTNILETEQRVHEQHAESSRELKKQAREMSEANEQYKHQLSTLTAELQAERRSYLELQESMAKLKASQAEERLKVQQQLMDVVQTWEREAKSREETVRNEMEKGFLMRLSAEKELFERQRESEQKLLRERMEVEHSKNTTMLRDKLEAMKKNELLEYKAKLENDRKIDLSKQRTDYEIVIRSMKDEVDEALNKVKLKETELASREADLQIQRADLKRTKEEVTGERNKLDIREQMGWIEGVAGKIIESSREKLKEGIAEERKDLENMRERTKLKKKKYQNIAENDFTSSDSEISSESEFSDSSSDRRTSKKKKKKKKEKKKKKSKSKKSSSSSSSSLKKQNKKIHRSPPPSSESDGVDQTPFFTNVDDQINEIMDSQNLFKHNKHLSLHTKTDIDAKRENGENLPDDDIGGTLDLLNQLKTTIPSIPKKEVPHDALDSINSSNLHPQYSSLTRPTYSYGGSMEDANLMRSPREAFGRQATSMSTSNAPAAGGPAGAWGEASMAAAWMPRSFYQEYVRTQRTDR